MYQLDCMCEGFVLQGGSRWEWSMHAAGSPEEVKRHVEPLKELALLTPAGINAVEFKTGTKQFT